MTVEVSSIRDAGMAAIDRVGVTKDCGNGHRVFDLNLIRADRGHAKLLGLGSRRDSLAGK
jgi:hypothetical protein